MEENGLSKKYHQQKLQDFLEDMSFTPIFCMNTK